MWLYCALASRKQVSCPKATVVGAWHTRHVSIRRGFVHRLCRGAFSRTGSPALWKRLSVQSALVVPSIHPSQPEESDPEEGKLRAVPLGDIFPNDYVVHNTYGVGKYLGLEFLRRRILNNSTGNATELQEFIVLQYADGILRVPVDQVELLSRLQSGVLDVDEDTDEDSELPYEEVETSRSVRGRKPGSGKASRVKKRALGGKPRLDAISRTRNWEQRRNRAFKAVQKAAIDILQIEALRKSVKRPRYRFDPKDPLYVDFDSAFEYNSAGGLTEDQQRCVADVFSDLCERDLPMDRLICGDVGVGKTEVAMRAIFLAILNNRQVAVLAPTTTLAAQHLRTLRRRMPEYVRIGALYRDVSTREARQVLEDVASGKIDILVGTHALLNERVRFHLRRRHVSDAQTAADATAAAAARSRSGSPTLTPASGNAPRIARDGLLLVIDEEQRFGVTHKEKIKILDQTRSFYADDIAVDVLTLSATPIPRTLYMALSGIRDVSMIHRAPASRLPVRTFILAQGPESELLVAKAIAHELRRGGQVFYVVPRIADIPAAYERIKASLASKKLEVVHYPILVGHSRTSRLEDVMVSFASGRGRILLSTTIVENGIDIPSAGTMIVESAHKFGLAQLYQLRGRVGRCANLQAYCLYLFDSRVIEDNQDAQMRLQALRELTQERSAQKRNPRSVGLRIAQRDLEIRGAGDLLGASQSGTQWNLGPELFTKMLREAIKHLQYKQKRERTFADSSAPSPSLREYMCVCEFALQGLSPAIPRYLIPDSQQRAQVYRDLTSVGSESELDEEFADVLRGRPMPKPLQHLVLMMKTRLYARQLGVLRISSEGSDTVLQSPAPVHIWKQILDELRQMSTRSRALSALNIEHISCRSSIQGTQILLRGTGKLPAEKQLSQVLALLRACNVVCTESGFC
jgi:transcription-repair coupling factor (superfamily II helicase)